MDPTSKKQKRLSSLFSLSWDNSASNLSSTSTSSHQRDSSQDLMVAPQVQSSPTQQKLQKIRAASGRSEPFSEQSSLQDPLDPPPLLLASHGSPRPLSSHGSPSNSRDGSRSRPQTPVLMVPDALTGTSSRPLTPTSGKLSKRSLLPGKSDRSTSGEQGPTEARAWIAGLREHIPYDVSPLLNGLKLHDLWNENGDTLIYFFPKSSGKGPSLKINSSLFDDSVALQHLFQASTTGNAGWTPHTLDPNLVSGRDHDLSIQSPGGSTAFSSFQHPYRSDDHFSHLSIDGNGEALWERHVHVPLAFDDPSLASPGAHPKGDDLELLVLYRNFFAFLLGGALISTPRQVSVYSIFVGISTVLIRFEFTNSDGSTFGDVCSNSFARYCDELRLADVRSSREKTIEAIVLGEKMKYWALYNEGFTHAVGKLEDMKGIHSPKLDLVSQITRSRLERASHDLSVRLAAIHTRLDDFDFPSMFSGIANSVTSAEAKLVRFKAWKLSFLTFRKHTIAYYRQKFGAWPPKANSKKHNFEESGLNRLLLQGMYRDFTDLYDMLVDRNSLTMRTSDLAALTDNDAESADLNESIQHAIRRVESEYDRSTPPVLPPIPFDTPLVPAFANSFNRQHVMIPNNSARTTRRLKDNETNEVLLGSYNRESIKASPWIQDFLAYERKTGHGKTMDEIVDMRCGQWLFMYAVLQTLPNLVVDARDLKFTEGAEYFLCIPSRGGNPWMKEDTTQSRSWYNVASGGGLVSLPNDMIDHSVEGIYRRSHCWTVATKWAADLGPISPEQPQQFMSEDLLPPALVPGARPNSSSPHLSPHTSPYQSPHLRAVSPVPSEGRLSRNSNRSSMHLGLEAVAAPQVRSRPVSMYNPNTTFDSILGPAPVSPAGKKGKK